MIGGPVDEADQTDQSESRSCSPAEYILRDQAFILPTPPASPDQQLLQLQQLPKRVLTQVPQQLPPLPRPWRGIFELSRQKNGRYVLRNSLIHPQGLPRSQVQARRPLLFFTEALSEDIDSDMNDDAFTVYGMRESSFLNTRDLSVHNTRESSPSRASVRDEEAFKHERPDLGADVYSALVLLDLYRKDREKLQAIEDDNESDLYDDDANIYLDAESPREAWEANKLASNSIFTALCNLKDPQCPYTKLSTKLHYHCPPEKCQLSEPFPLSNPWLFNQEQQLLASSHDPSHVHCVSRLGPFPDSAGECHLFNSIRSFPNHKCCYWNQADLDTIPERGKRAYESKKLEEAKRMHLRILDRREWISGWLGVEREVSIRDLEGRLDGGGREWMQELERGDWDGEVGRVIGSVGEYLGLEGVDRQLALEM